VLSPDARIANFKTQAHEDVPYCHQFVLVISLRSYYLVAGKYMKLNELSVTLPNPHPMLASPRQRCGNERQRRRTRFDLQGSEVDSIRGATLLNNRRFHGA
jgi:hypothetical protein